MSNRLTALAADLAELHRDVERHTIAAAEKAIAAGKLLSEAKSLAGHGGWLPFLADAGIPARTAQRYMRLGASPLNASAVSHLGGITQALAFLAKWKMPKKGEALHICEGEGDDENFAFVFEDEDAPGHFMVCALIGDDCVRTKRPMLPLIEIEGEQPVDTILTWLEAQGFPASERWEVQICDLELARSLINPTWFFAMVADPKGEVAA
ncbi:MAG: hypothetical protein KDK24_19120 [Pseudooceanicola sp.]|nr:hypothetical protein [Pseudooceanicola sp.]